MTLQSTYYCNLNLMKKETRLGPLWSVRGLPVLGVGGQVNPDLGVPFHLSSPPSDEAPGEPVVLPTPTL